MCAHESDHEVASCIVLASMDDDWGAPRGGLARAAANVRARCTGTFHDSTATAHSCACSQLHAEC